MGFLAQETSPTSFLGPTLLVGVIIALLIGAVALLRKRMMGDQSGLEDPMAGFSLSNLRQLVKEGKMTPEEYEAAKKQIVAVAQRNADKETPAPAEPPVEHKTPTDQI